MELFPAYGGAPFAKHSKKVIRLILKGCVNRPFFHISVQEKSKDPEEQVIEQIGNYDPMPNEHNEKLVAINFQRLEFWLKQGAEPTTSVKKLLGLSGYFPVHPLSLEEAFIRRKTLMQEIQDLKIKAAEFSIEEGKSSQEPQETSQETSDTASTPEQSSSTSAEEEHNQDSDNKGDSKN